LASVSTQKGFIGHSHILSDWMQITESKIETLWSHLCFIHNE